MKAMIRYIVLVLTKPSHQNAYHWRAYDRFMPNPYSLSLAFSYTHKHQSLRITSLASYLPPCLAFPPT